jgi:hypothetical protein
MCLACEMEAMWFAAMEARTAPPAAQAVAQPDQAAEMAALLPPLENGSVGEAITGDEHGAGGGSVDPRPNPQGGKGSRPARRGFSCEETPGE